MQVNCHYWVRMLHVRKLMTFDPRSGMAGQVSDVEVCCWAYEGHAGRLRTALAEDAKLLQRTDCHHRTALHWACASGRTEIVRMLITLGAEVTVSQFYI